MNMIICTKSVHHVSFSISFKIKTSQFYKKYRDISRNNRSWRRVNLFITFLNNQFNFKFQRKTQFGISTRKTQTCPSKKMDKTILFKWKFWRRCRNRNEMSFQTGKHNTPSISNNPRKKSTYESITYRVSVD
jgi:hypothetical protein